MFILRVYECSDHTLTVFDGDMIPGCKHKTIHSQKSVYNL